MQHKNIDGLFRKKVRILAEVRVRPQKKPIVRSFDGLRRKPAAAAPALAPAVRRPAPGRLPPPQSVFSIRYGLLHRVLVPGMVLAIALAFFGGMGFALYTPESAADTEHAAAPAAAGTVTTLGAVPAGGDPGGEGIFNIPLEMLQSYFTAAASKPDSLELRRGEIEQFLKDYNSPLLPDAGIIAEQSHWKIILAIAFAESTLGQKCYSYNCSGIGGSNIREYKSYANWVLDFNRLLERRYKDWTLQEMCGVYVQPCNPNWLLATQQILDDLSERGID